MKDTGKLPSSLEPLVDAERAAPPGSMAVRDEVFERLSLTLGDASLATAGAGGAGFLVGHERSEVVVVQATDVAPPTAAREPVRAQPEPAPAPIVEPAVPPAPQAPAAAAPVANEARATEDRPAAAPEPPEPTGDPSPAVRESRLLRQAWIAYETGAYDEAVRVLEAHAAAYETGLLAEERDALWIRALVDAGEGDAARQRAAAFRDTYPESIHTGAVEQALDGIPQWRIPKRNHPAWDKDE